MNRFFCFLFVLLLTSTTGCSLYHVSSQDVSDTYYPSKASIKDVAYMEHVTQAHDIIGVVTVNTERSQHMSEIVDKMKREAAILGGDAITDIQSDATGDWKRLPAQELIGNAYVRANFKANVVVLK